LPPDERAEALAWLAREAGLLSILSDPRLPFIQLGIEGTYLPEIPTFECCKLAVEIDKLQLGTAGPPGSKGTVISYSTGAEVKVAEGAYRA